MTKRNAHDRALEKIAANPGSFGFEGIIYVAVEPKLLDKSGRLVAEPDLILKSKKGEVIIIEYKGNGNDSLRERAEEQLARASTWFGRYEEMDLDKIQRRIITGTDPRYKELFK
jgi:hypothetical protein|tara:strand:- start:646 stop:987 length:342 start_codon:yes stop_codon:yes gene_type:complete